MSNENLTTESCRYNHFTIVTNGG